MQNFSIQISGSFLLNYWITKLTYSDNEMNLALSANSVLQSLIQTSDEVINIDGKGIHLLQNNC